MKFEIRISLLYFYFLYQHVKAFFGHLKSRILTAKSLISGNQELSHFRYDVSNTKILNNYSFLI